MSKILAGENTHSAIITYLKDKDCDVLVVAHGKSLTGCFDYRLVHVAQKEQRIIISAYKHVEQLAELYAGKKKTWSNSAKIHSL